MKRNEQRVEHLRQMLTRPGAKLVLLHSKGCHQYQIVPGNRRVTYEER